MGDFATSAFLVSTRWNPVAIAMEAADGSEDGSEEGSDAVPNHAAKDPRRAIRARFAATPPCSP